MAVCLSAYLTEEETWNAYNEWLETRDHTRKYRSGSSSVQLGVANRGPNYDYDVNKGWTTYRGKGYEKETYSGRWGGHGVGGFSGQVLRWHADENPETVRLNIAKFLSERQHMQIGIRPNADPPRLPYPRTGPNPRARFQGQYDPKTRYKSSDTQGYNPGDDR
jgi:hypothetical protein